MSSEPAPLDAVAGSGAAAEMPTKLILFDIDGTLLATGGAGERALRVVVEELYGDPTGLQGIEIAGRTDSGIARQILRKFGQAGNSEEPDLPQKVAALLEVYLRHLERLLPLIAGRLLPGVEKLLAELERRPNVLMGLLTGNTARGAQLKLEHYGIWRYFGFGAYADDHHDRNALGQFASRRAVEKLGRPIASADTYVIGDTPHDIACGRAFQAKTIAVCTGVHSREQLAPHAPDYLFDDLSDVEAVLRIIG